MKLVAVCTMVASAFIILLLGCLHLLYTFRGPKLLPRDAKLQQDMQAISPVISRETTMWKTWVGFNASHSFGAMLFGLIYGYLSLMHADFLFKSTFLLAVGLALLGGYTFLGHRYWFSIPFRSIVLALILYTASIAVLLITQ